jgi:hypothetical protein
MSLKIYVLQLHLLHQRKKTRHTVGRCKHDGVVTREVEGIVVPLILTVL